MLKEEFERAEALLAESQAEAGEEGDVRCPKCGSWRVGNVSQMWQMLKAGLGLAAFPEPMMECHACGHREPPNKFQNAVRAATWKT